MIRMANADNSVALIILGSGPKKERTMENPIPYETKEAFLRYILPGELRYFIMQMSSSLADVYQWYNSVLTHIPPPRCVDFIRFAGDKGDNATKLQYMDDHLSKPPNCKAGTISIPPVMANASTEMSATQVRKFAYRAHLDQLLRGIDGYEVFNATYGGFYREFTRNIYEDIIMPALEATPEQIDAYIKTSKMPSKSKTAKKAKAKPKTAKKAKAKSKTAKKSIPNAEQTSKPSKKTKPATFGENAESANEGWENEGRANAVMAYEGMANAGRANAGRANAGMATSSGESDESLNE